MEQLAFKKCIDCGEDLIPGDDWPDLYQRKGVYRHKRCNQNTSKANAVIRFVAYEMMDINSQADWKDLPAEDKALGWALARKHLGIVKVKGSKEVKPSNPTVRPVPNYTNLTVSKTPGGNDTAILRMMKYNLEIMFPNGCEFTQAGHGITQVNHFVTRKWCKMNGYEGWISFMDNVCYAYNAINYACEHYNNYIRPDGLLRVGPGGRMDPNLDALGVYESVIGMTPARIFFAQKHMENIKV